MPERAARRKNELTILRLLCLSLTTLGVVVGNLGCVSAIVRPDPALKISADEFRDQISTLCLMKFTTEVTLEDEDEKLARLEEDLSEALGKVGVETVSSHDSMNVWTEISATVGGYYDVHWGRIDAAKESIVKEGFYRDGLDRLGCQGVLYLDIVRVEASFWNGGANWDHKHVRESHGAGLVGYVPAVSLRIRINDAPDHEIYYGVGGVHLSVEMKSDELTDPHFEAVHDARNLAQQRETKWAIGRALDELKSGLTGGEKSNEP